MRLLTYRTDDGTRAGVVRGTEVTPLTCPDVGAVLAAAEAAELTPAEAVSSGVCAAAGDPVPLIRLDLAPVVTRSFPMQEAVSAFELASDRKRAMKVLIDFSTAG